ncbi:MAG: protocatechuate 3,4-dioxygenase subunit alpha [Alphaproteobacteria bacterium]|nr:protocatechuate 3,4-dioxygenase subunit alpha [Alphaproteobacteria bacterium]
MDTKLIPTATQTAGPFFHFGLLRPEWTDLTGGGKAKGDKIVLEGRVTDGDGAPLPDAIVEIWHANAAGKYDHPDDAQDKPLDPHFRGFGRAFTDKDGIYRFTTVKPGAVPGRGNALQAPHIAMSIAARGLLHHLFTRVYFAGESLNASDPVLTSIEDAARQKTLIATANGKAAGGTVWRFDVALQGKGETVFFDF